MHGKVILLTGAPATGKSTLAKILEEGIDPLRRISFGQLLFEHKRKTNPEFAYEELRAKSSQIISAEEVATLDAMLVAKVKEWRTVTNIIIDSHAVTKESYGFRITSFRYDLILELALDAILVLNSDPREIVRRMEQNSDGRAKASHDEVSQHIRLQESLALMYGVLCGCPTFILDSNHSPYHLAKTTLDILLKLGMSMNYSELGGV